MTKTYNVTVEIRMLVTVPMPVDESEPEEGQTMEDEAVAKVHGNLVNGEFWDLYQDEFYEATTWFSPDEYNTEIISVEEAETEEE